MGVSPYYLNAVAGNAESNAFIVHRFGRNSDVGTTFEPITVSGVYRTPQVGSATQLRVKAGNVNDTSDGTGAREIYIEGINTSGEMVSELLTTAGTSPSANSVNSYIRLNRFWVNKSGTYGTSAVGSHSGDITIENAAGTEDWATIDSSEYPRGQSEIGVYTIPKGKAAYLLDFEYSVDSTKTSAILLFKRENILDTAAPYQAVREVFSVEALVEDGGYSFDAPIGPFLEYTDLGFIGRASATGGVINVEFTLLVRDKE